MTQIILIITVGGLYTFIIISPPTPKTFSFPSIASNNSRLCQSVVIAVYLFFFLLILSSVSLMDR